MELKELIKIRVAEMSEIILFTEEQQAIIIQYLYGDDQMTEKQCIESLQLTASQRTIFISYCLGMNDETGRNE